MMRKITRFIRNIAPKPLFARAMLILVLPILLVQLISVYIFYDRHWASVTRQLSSSLAGEVTWLVEHWEHATAPQQRKWLALQAQRNYGLRVSMLPPMHSSPSSKISAVHFPVFESMMADKN